MVELKKENKKSRSLPTDNVDRFVLRRTESNKLNGWLSQINQELNGMIRVTKSDLANFVIAQRGDTLTEDEIAKLRVEHFSETRWLTWALGKVREANKNGEELSIEDLLAKRDSMFDRKSERAKRSRKPAAKGANNEATKSDGQEVDCNQTTVDQ